MSRLIYKGVKYAGVGTNAYNTPYVNTESGLTAVNVQDAIDEIVSEMGGGTAADITYDNKTSGLTAENVQAAVDELASEKQDAATAITTANIRSQSVSHASTADTAGQAGKDARGNTIDKTYLPKQNPSVNGNLSATGNISANGTITATNIPAPPAATSTTTDYVLKCTVASNGTVTYTWVANSMGALSYTEV